MELDKHSYRTSASNGLTARHVVPANHYERNSSPSTTGTQFTSHVGAELYAHQEESPKTPLVTSEGPVCCQGDVPAIYRENFILHGYRQPHDVVDCLRGIFRWHNETLNIWTHLIAGILCLLRLVILIYDIHKMRQMARSEEEADKVTRWWTPVVLFGIGETLVAFSSSTAHCFCLLTPRSYHICFLFDYLAICLGFLCSALGHIYFSAPSQTNPMATFFSYLTAYLMFALVLNTAAFFTMSILRLSIPGVFRTVCLPLATLCPFLWSITPMMTRYLYCQTEGSCEVLWKTAMPFHWAHILFALLTGFFLASKIPERFAPGKFDIVGQSHQIMHIFAFLSPSCAWRGLEVDLSTRWTELTHSSIQPTMTLSLAIPSIYLFVGLAGLAIIAKQINQHGQWK